MYGIIINNNIIICVIGGMKLNSDIDKSENRTIENLGREICMKPNDPKLYINRGIIFNNLGEQDKAIEDYTKAIELKSDNATVYYNRGISFNKNGEQEKAIADYTRSIELKPDYAEAYINRGIIFNNLEEQGKAIADYTNAIELNPDNATVYYNRGISFNKNGEQEKAIADYTRAIELNPDYADAYNNRGIIFRNIGKQEKVIEDYTKAIELKADNATAYYNRGIIFKEIGEQEKAIADYTKAIELKTDYANAYSNYGFLLKESGEYEKAKGMFLKAKEKYQLEDKPFYVSKMDNVIKELDEYINISDKNEIENKDLFSKVINQTKHIYSISNSKKSGFLEFLKPNNSPESVNYFEVLRRWNSYTPIVADNYHISKGGGYFLKINGNGIVIDPGLNFIENFKGQGHLFEEIDMVLISHSHNDHTADLESILALLHRYNENIKISDDPEIDTIEKDLMKNAKVDNPWDKLSEKERKNKIDIEFEHSPKRKIIEFYMTVSTFKKFSGMFELFDRTNYRIHIIEEGSITIVDGTIKIGTLRAKHFDIISDNSAVGFTIRFDNYLLIYTGDTGINEDVAVQYQKILEDIDEGIYLILLAHIGGFKDYESKYDKSRKYENFYKDHIGRLGLVELNNILKPKICLISEFGEEFKESRVKISEIYNGLFENKITFLSADIGLKLIFNVDDVKVEAINHVSMDNYKTEKGYFLPEDIEVCLLRKDYSLHYYSKKEQDFSEGDLIQVLIEEFEEYNR